MKKNTTLVNNIRRFTACNEAMRIATLKSERDFLREAGNISTAQLHIILSIREKGTLMMSELADMLHFTRANVTQLVDKLVDKKYLKRIRSDNDRRVISVSLLAKAKIVAKLYQEHVERTAHDWLSHMSAEEQEGMLSTWEKYLSNKR